MIYLFAGPYAFLSNFYPAIVSLDGVAYPTVEHAYQAAKTDNRGLRQQILECEHPGQAKRLSHRLRLRSVDWDERKLLVMKSLVRQKFSSDLLRPLLLETRPARLIEGNTWGDTFWGMVKQYDPVDGTPYWYGSNHLGKLLMEIREEIWRLR